ncbi:hypothetical protein GGI12_000017 [Dipsacomyces acuminosporus]|nr:hypothetical protein GGI12_000017 [Dipsacomyces acuminosporus]
MALAYLLSRCVDRRNCYAVTVDHGFRPESAFEAQSVGRYMRQLGIRHEVRRLEWCESQGRGRDGGIARMPPAQRLEEVARERRYAAIASFCDSHSIGAVLTGHHAGDQAETFLLRFLRHSGVYGMAGMPVQTALPHADKGNGASASQPGSPVLVRPLLGLKKGTLYDICKAASISWHEDASNKDTRFKRNHLRQLISEKSGSSESPFNEDSLLRVCAAMQGHRAFINQQLSSLVSKYTAVNRATGTVALSPAVDMAQGSALPAWAQNAALRERLLANTVGWVSHKSHPPELEHLRQFEQAILRFYSYKAGKAGACMKEPRSIASAAGVAMLQPTSKRGWLFFRQPPRSGEIRPIQSIPLGATVVWDKRLAICARRRGDSATWNVHSLDEAARLWPDKIANHRSRLRRERKQLEPRAVQATQPVISINTADGATHRGAVPVFALGHALGQGSAGSGELEVHIAALRNPDLSGGAELF